MQTILVTDTPDQWSFLNHCAHIVEASDYLSNTLYSKLRALRVINLCNSYHHQTIGYYVSLLAHAREHKAIPSVHSIQDVLSAQLAKLISDELEAEMQYSLRKLKTDKFILSMYFGENIAKCHTNLIKKLYGLFPLPLLRFTIIKKKQWRIQSLQLLSIQDIPAAHTSFFKTCAKNYLTKKRFYPARKKQHYHNLAMLIDPNEPNAPSDKKALEYFIDAGDAMGIHVNLIEKNDIKSLAEYDALFIRTTTAVNHFTYRAARHATQENLVVIDDPQSIIKCTNKVYLAELLQSHQILTPPTIFLSKYTQINLQTLTFPCILKRPDSAFSQGVVKVDHPKSLQKYLTQFFKTSDLVLVQPFLPTEYDWRIGILDHQAIFACRYFMARDHWQIYNWEGKEPEHIAGAHETLCITDVPEAVLKLALKSTKLIGDGLYGVDIKHHNNQYYVIEINDNPSIDTGVEDLVHGMALYEHIMQIFLKRIRKNHGYI